MSDNPYEPLLPGPVSDQTSKDNSSESPNKPLKWLLGLLGGLVGICLCVGAVGTIAYMSIGRSASRSTIIQAVPTALVRTVPSRTPAVGAKTTPPASANLKATATPEVTVNDLLKEAYDRLNQGDAKGALELADRAIAQDPKVPASYWVRGWTNLKLENKPELALKDFEKVIELEPEQGIGYSGRGQAQLALNQFDDAMKNLDTAIDKGLEDEWTYISRAEARLNVLAKAESRSIDEAWSKIERDHKEAVDASLVDLDKAITLTPKFYVALNMRSFLYLNMQDYEKSLADAQTMVTLQPKYYAAYNTRAWVYANWGKGEEAVKDCLKALDLVQSEDAAILDTCGLAYYAVGDYKEALVYYDRALTAAPDQIDSLYRRAQVHQKLKDKTKAIADYQQYVKEGKSLRFIEDSKKALKALGVK
jgi:tetratricopeptide (TPR) repeat protein